MKRVPVDVKAQIEEICSKILGFNSVGKILSLETPDGVMRTAIEAVIHEKAESIGRDYLLKPEVLNTIKSVQAFDNVLEYIFSVFHNGVKENYFVCLCSKKPRLGTFKPVGNLIINLP